MKKTMEEGPEEAPACHHPEYERGLQKAILWLLAHQTAWQPEYLAENMQSELLPFDP
jgi:hypothetical protein